VRRAGRLSSKKKRKIRIYISRVMLCRGGGQRNTEKKVVLTSNGRDEVLDMTEAAKYTPMTPTPAAASAARQGQMLPGMAPRTVEPELQGAEPQQFENPQPAPPGRRPRIIRPNRRTYTPLPGQPSQ